MDIVCVCLQLEDADLARGVLPALDTSTQKYVVSDAFRFNKNSYITLA